VWSNLCGVAVGMEAGYSQFGAAVLAKVGQYFRLRRDDQRIFVAAGAGAAIAAAFNAPLCGAFYAYELILGGYSVRALAPVAAASLAATLAERALTHSTALFVLPPLPDIPPWFYLMFAVLGALAAGYSVLIMQSVTWAERWLRGLPLPQWLRPAVGGLLVTVWRSSCRRCWRRAWRDPGAVRSRPGPAVPAGPAGHQADRRAISLGAGFRGGMFSTSLMLGCVFGAVFGQSPGPARARPRASPADADAGRHGAVAAAVIGSPLTMAFLVLEGTDNFPVTIGVMVGVVIASTIVRLTFGYSFSTWRFHQRGIGIRSPLDIGWLADLTVGRLMRTDAKTVPDTTPLKELASNSRRAAPSACSSSPGTGALSACSTSRPARGEAGGRARSRTARDFARDGELFLLPYENVRTALSRFEDKEVEALPVFESPTDRHVLGISPNIRPAALQPGARAAARRRPGRARSLLDRRAAAVR
jgi:CIC family chloride channel protein